MGQAEKEIAVMLSENAQEQAEESRRLLEEQARWSSEAREARFAEQMHRAAALAVEQR